LHHHFRISALVTIADLEDKADKAWQQGDYKAADNYAEQAQAKRKKVS
jgi:hypothetical protein